jgi:ribonuclease PH
MRAGGGTRAPLLAGAVLALAGCAAPGPLL